MPDITEVGASGVHGPSPLGPEVAGVGVQQLGVPLEHVGALHHIRHSRTIANRPPPGKRRAATPALTEGSSAHPSGS
ncbi:hypothetical protein GCM10022399_16080 [Terrabacter ginsenosidimutans]|uniref:Uncharacterized protein n=1 Tax=Terrabacter ginsenosidimutans TaxID=490575 RepID=A0ABP7D3I1_9MICO